MNHLVKQLFKENKDVIATVDGDQIVAVARQSVTLVEVEIFCEINYGVIVHTICGVAFGKRDRGAKKVVCRVDAVIGVE